MALHAPAIIRPPALAFGDTIAIAAGGQARTVAAGATLTGAMTSRHVVDTPMTVRALLRQPTGYLPVAMSVGALATIVWFVAAHGVVHQPDEGAQAHLWQLLVAGQLPLIGYFALRWLPITGPTALVVLALQAAAVLLLAIAPLGVLGGL